MQNTPATGADCAEPYAASRRLTLGRDGGLNEVRKTPATEANRVEVFAQYVVRKDWVGRVSVNHNIAIWLY